MDESGKGPPTDTSEIPSDRFVFFTDAVAAIAMTLLALDLPIPHGSTNAALWSDFRDHWSSDYFPLLLSFVVIAAFWRTHHAMFRHVTKLGPGVMPLNFAFLLMIVLLPFVTKVLGEDGSFQIGVVLYASVVAATSVLLGQLAALLLRRGLIEPLNPSTSLTSLRWAMHSNALVFALSIPIGFVSPRLGIWSWLVLSVIAHLIDRVWHSRTRAPALPSG
jgi:uncharacterized membrane protein